MMSATAKPGEALHDGGLSEAARLARAAPLLSPALRAEYETLFDTCKTGTSRQADVSTTVRNIAAKRGRYETLQKALGVPWAFVGVVHSLEAGLRFDRHLHNGDPLTARTVHEPSGRPVGTPPFTWEKSAQDALTLKRLNEWSDWSLAGILYELEEYNGFGYRLYHPDIRSPYLWSFSNHYQKGKYVSDGKYDPNAVSQQCGGAVLLRAMVDGGVIEPPSEGPPLRYSGASVIAKGKELQAFLNTFDGIDLDEDGKLGPSSSDAFRALTGYLLQGDPRH